MGAQPFRAVACQSFSAVLTGVPQITTWTTPQRCCRNGWPLWAETMQLWCGSLRKRQGSNLRARVLEEMENSRSPSATAPRAGCVHFLQRRGSSLKRTSHPPTSGPTQMNRVPSTGPKKGISF